MFFTFLVIFWLAITWSLIQCDLLTIWAAYICLWEQLSTVCLFVQMSNMLAKINNKKKTSSLPVYAVGFLAIFFPVNGWSEQENTMMFCFSQWVFLFFFFNLNNAYEQHVNQLNQSCLPCQLACQPATCISHWLADQLRGNNSMLGIRLKLFVHILACLPW